MRIIFMCFQHESTITENASSGAVNLNRRQSDLQKDLHHLMELYNWDDLSLHGIQNTSCSESIYADRWVGAKVVIS